jgi:hypothetical protein
MKYFYIPIIFFILASCTGNDGRNKRGTERETITITPTELLEKFELFEFSEKSTKKYYKKHRIQMTGVMTNKNIMYDDVIKRDRFGNRYMNAPKSTIDFGDLQELGWEIWFYFDGNVVDELHTGDTVTIQGSLEKAKMYKDFPVGAILSLMPDDEGYYKDVIIIDIKDCVVIGVEKLEL